MLEVRAGREQQGLDAGGRRRELASAAEQVQVRRDDQVFRTGIEPICDDATRVRVEAERALLRATRGGCRAPVGAYAEIEGYALSLIAGHAQPDGSGLRIGRGTGLATEGLAIADALYRDLWPQTIEAAL